MMKKFLLLALSLTTIFLFSSQAFATYNDNLNCPDGKCEFWDTWNPADYKISDNQEVTHTFNLLTDTITGTTITNGDDIGEVWLWVYTYDDNDYYPQSEEYKIRFDNGSWDYDNEDGTRHFTVTTAFDSDYVLLVNLVMTDGDMMFDKMVVNGCVTHNPVPEPATMMLFGLGLLGLAGVSRKRK